ncbi:putative E3 ubiquitin-protein ligase HERC3 [Aulostomus maculatus]
MECWGDVGGRRDATAGNVTKVSAGRNVLVCVKGDRYAVICRTNLNKDGGRVRGNPKSVQCPKKIQAVSCGDDVVTVLCETGSVLLVDSSQSPLSLRPLKELTDIPVVQVACGRQHCLALSKYGQVYTWGEDSRGQLGLGKYKLGASSPKHLRYLSSIPVVRIAAGGEQSFALSDSRGVFSWGRNTRGQLGLGDTTDRHTPTANHYLIMKNTVQVSCGEDHTAILTKDGAVFTFGSGEYGQLGHNSFGDELRPRRVAELWRAKVTKIACGRDHTWVLMDSGSVYSFGCGEQGQLGREEGSHQSVPLPVQLQQGGAKIRHIHAGGNCSFATSNEQEFESTDDVMLPCLEDMIEKWTSRCDSASWRNTKKEIKRAFSFASCMNRSFLNRSGDKHCRTSPKYSGLNLALARRNFKTLMTRVDVLTEVETAVIQLLPSLDKAPVGLEGLRIYLLLNELHCTIHKHKKQHPTKLAEAIALSLQSLSADNLRVLVDWWASLSPSTMIKHVKVWKGTLAAILSQNPVPRNSGVTSLLLILQQMYNANNRTAGSQKIPNETFYLEINWNFLEEDLKCWRSVSKKKPKYLNGHEPLILCGFPFLMDLKSKKMVFDTNIILTRMEQGSWVPFGFMSNPYFELRLNRQSFLEDAFQQLHVADHSDLKKTLVVYFDGDPKMTDVYKRDFFHHLFPSMFSSEPEMFVSSDSGRLAWFPSTTAEEDRRRFFLFGVLCGLALCNQSIIHLPFPLALFKKLLDVEPSLEDMLEYCPSVAKSLQYILDYEDDDLEKQDFIFMISWNGTEVELDPQNPAKPVTNLNKKEFVEAYVNHVFNASVEGVFQEFRRGFFTVCDKDLVGLFQPEELQRVLVGGKVFDWATLKQNTIYELEYHVSHPTILMFWEVFGELTEDQRKDFLWFLTGFRRVPILGMSEIQMRVQVALQSHLAYDQHFPESLTCHSILELPLYSSKEIMRDRLTEAIIPERRFST